MGENSKTMIPRVVSGTEPPEATLQTPGMNRRPAIHKDSVGASKIWFGTVTCEPNQKGPPHHHGEAETAAYVITGHIRVYYGEDFEEYVEAGPGDYIFVPANLWHIEENPIIFFFKSIAVEEIIIIGFVKSASYELVQQ